MDTHREMVAVEEHIRAREKEAFNQKQSSIIEQQYHRLTKSEIAVQIPTEDAELIQFWNDQCVTMPSNFGAITFWCAFFGIILLSSFIS
jgi:hypothetical protein